MTDTIPASPPLPPAHAAPTAGTPAQLMCLTASFAVSGTTLLLGTIGFWMLRHHNALVAEGAARGPVKTMMGSIRNAQSDRPMYLFLMLVAGVAAMVLAFIGAKATTRKPWVAVLAGALAAALLIIPATVIVNEQLTAGIYGGD